jgi:acylphosphatase
MTSAKAQVRLVIYGRVQGVGFRFATAHEARSLGLTGCVRNQANGSVEVRAEGERGRLGMLVAWAHQGPRAARVTRVEEEWSEYEGKWDDFEVC